MRHIPFKTGPYLLLILFVGLAYAVDFSTYDEYGSFAKSNDTFLIEADDPETKTALICPDAIDIRTNSFLPKPPLLLVTLSLESDEITQWLGDSPPLPRAPPPFSPVIRF